MITLICKCGHPIYQHACDPFAQEWKYHAGPCREFACKCKAFNIEIAKTRHDTAQHRHKAMMDRKDLQ